MRQSFSCCVVCIQCLVQVGVLRRVKHKIPRRGPPSASEAQYRLCDLIVQCDRQVVHEHIYQMQAWIRGLIECRLSC